MNSRSFLASQIVGYWEIVNVANQGNRWPRNRIRGVDKWNRKSQSLIAKGQLFVVPRNNNYHRNRESQEANDDFVVKLCFECGFVDF